MYISSHFDAQTFEGIFCILRKILPILLEVGQKSGIKKKKNARPSLGVILCDLVARKDFE
jgi:hypothetical protein